MNWQEFPDAQAVQKLLERPYELGLLVLDPVQLPKPYVAVPLFARPLVLLVYEGHPLYSCDAVDISQLRTEKLIMEGSDFWVHDTFCKACLTDGFYPDIAAETGDISLCHHLCAMGRWLSLSVDFVSDVIPLPNVRAIPFTDPSLRWPVYLVSQDPRYLSPAATAFRNYLRSSFSVPDYGTRVP